MTQIENQSRMLLSLLVGAKDEIFVIALTAFTLVLPLSAAGVPALGVNVLVATIGLWSIKRLVDRMISYTMQYRLALSIIALLAIGTNLFNAALPNFTLQVDRDEALNIAATRFVAGQYPYDARTPIGHPISPLMGAVFLSMPFVFFAGNSSWQTFAWLVIALWYFMWKSDHPLLFMIGICLSAPLVLEIFYNNDLLANNLYVVLAMIWMITSSSKPLSIASAVFAGFALASRFNFMFWIPSAIWFIAVTRGKREALYRIGIVLFVFTILTIPFYLADPAHFSPLHAISKVTLTALPNSGIIFVAVSMLVALAIAPFATSLRRVLVCGAIAQATPILCVVLVTMVTREYDSIFIALAFGINVSVPLLFVIAMRTKQSETSP